MKTNFVTIIEKKKNGQELNEEEIRFFASGAADGSIPSYQLSALLMAIRLNGMTDMETYHLTMAMAESGDHYDLSRIPGIKVDKHSTGGVGDTTTLILVPLVAACGVPVAKMSGRGLGHTGGTLDKLESIPGFSVDIDEESFLEQVRGIGLAVVGQTKNLAPADKVLYALRDVTSTVDSVPLIASSIISKKLASGADAIVLDVKTGEGALMHTLKESIELAELMVRIGCHADRKVSALITDMDQPLGTHIGNALEVKEAIDVLSGRTKGALLDVSLHLGSGMLYAAGAAESYEEARSLLLKKLENGEGLQKLREMIIAQHGDPACCDDTGALPRAAYTAACTSLKSGFITRMHTVQLGNISRELGAGRFRVEDQIDPGVGFVLHKRVGDRVEIGELLVTVYAKNEQDAAAAVTKLREAILIGPERPETSPLVKAIVTEDMIEFL